MNTLRRKRKVYTSFRPRIRSRHPSHGVLRPRHRRLPLMPFRSIVRFGSTTENEDSRVKVELNTPDAIRNSSSKLLMKECFTRGDVQTAMWWTYRQGFTQSNDQSNERTSVEDLPYPIVCKSYFGSRNQGNTKVDSVEEMNAWMTGKNLHNFIFEVFHNYAREYRLHVTEEGCFYACRKVLKRDTPDEDKWYRNDEHCNWIREDGSNLELFDKPSNWNHIVEECVKALTSVGLDFGACDLRVQSSKSSNTPHFIVVEINSAPSFGDVTTEKYTEVIPKLLRSKYEKSNQ